MRWFWNVISLIAIAAALALWVNLPPPGVLALAALTLLWLALSQSGRRALAASGIGIASLPQRWGAASIIVIGIGGVVAVLVSMLAMAAGFHTTLSGSGNDETAIALRGGAQVEVNSVITREQAALLAHLDGVARGGDGQALLSPELSQVISLPGRSDGAESNVQLRGVGQVAWALRPQVKITAGRAFRPGLRELVVGEGVAAQYRGVGVGEHVRLGSQDWQVVGHFRAGDALDSEVWGDLETLSSFYRRSSYQSALVKLDGADGLTRLRAALEADPRLKLDAETTRHYFGKQSGRMRPVIEILGRVIGAIMAVGAVFGALNTMYAAVAMRAREIATLRAIGFGALPVVVAVMLETWLLALLGGLIGGGLAYLVFNGYSASTMSANFSTIVFAFDVTPALLWTGLQWALGIGLIGGLFPALRAARLPIVAALRAV